MSKVSLVTGCFNGENFIYRCFDSILNQTYPYLEVIFIDDGSTDNSLKTAESYREQFAAKGYDFLVIPQKNMGFYPQSGIKVSSGKYITTLDIDDVLLPYSIEKRVKFFEQNPDFSVVRTNGYYVEENKKRGEILFVVNEEEKNNHYIFEDLLYAKTNNWAGTYMVKSEVLFKVYPDKIVPMDRICQNLQILMPVSYFGKAGFIDEPLMKYFRHGTSFTFSKNSYETTKKHSEAFKEVRIKIATSIGVYTDLMDEKLSAVYDRVFLGIAYRFKNKTDFNKYYSKLPVPTIEEKFMNAAINDRKIQHFYMRVLNRFNLLK